MSIRKTHEELQSIRREADKAARYELLLDENGMPIAGIAAVLAGIDRNPQAGYEGREITAAESWRHRRFYLNTGSCMS